MTVLWFILGIALIFGMARYNESNKLFWTLLFSFIMGFAGAKMVIDSHRGNEQNNGSLVQVYPTQMSTTVYDANAFLQTTMSLTSKKVTALNSASQEIIPAGNETNFILSEVFRRTRDQPLITQLIKPPELCLQKDFLILHDSG